MLFDAKIYLCGSLIPDCVFTKMTFGPLSFLPFSASLVSFFHYYSIPAPDHPSTSREAHLQYENRERLVYNAKNIIYYPGISYYNINLSHEASTICEVAC